MTATVTHSTWEHDAAIEAVGIPAAFELCQQIVAVAGRIANIAVQGKPVSLHLRLACGQPEAIVNDICNWRVFDAVGAIDSRAAHAIDAAVPTEAQRVKRCALVFGNVRATTNTEITP